MGATTLIIMTLNIMTLIIMTLNIMSLGIMTVRIKVLIGTLNITTLPIMPLIIGHWHNDSQNKGLNCDTPHYNTHHNVTGHSP